MFGGDDDDDFTPNPSSTSKLASLFGFGKSSDEGNTSLTYTAPKQPKKGRAESQSAKVPETTSATNSPAKLLSIIVVKAVHTYKLAEGNYNAQGKLGAAVLGNTTTRVYQLLLYKGKQQHVTSCRINPHFQFVVQANNYATFYDDHTQNWSVMFDCNDDAIEFAREVGLARGNAAKEPSDQQKLMTQDLLFGVGSGASEGDMVEVRYIVYPMSDGKLGKELENTTQSEKPLRVKIKKDSWEEGLLGASKGCKRMIMLPPSRTGQWQGKLSPGSGVMIEVDIGRIKTTRTDSGDSTDDTSIKARGASISEALTNSPKTHKASLISRMARMGQATLPLKGAIACNPSDSEETEEESNVVNKTPIKPRVTKSRPAAEKAEKPVQNVMLPPQQVAVYQPVSVPWQQTAPPQQPQQFVRANGSVTYMQPSYPLQTVSTPQMYPVSTPPAVPSPDSHLSVFLAETRTQNSEVRMGVAKVVDKVDQVLMKLDTMQQLQQRRESSTGIMEPSSVLASIQKMANENETLRTEVEEKRNKIEQLYSMLHSNMMESRNDSLVLTLQQEKAQLSADLGEARSRTSSLEMLVTSRGEELVSSKQLVKDQEQKLEAMQKELNDCQKQISDLTRIHQEELRKVERDAAANIEHLRNLEQENAALKDRIRDLQDTAQKISTPSNVVNEVKKVMNVVYHQTAAQFSPDMSYSGSKVKQMLMGTIRDVTLKYLESKSQGNIPAQQGENIEAGEDRISRPSSKSEVRKENNRRPSQTEEVKEESSSKVPTPNVNKLENAIKMKETEVQDSVKYKSVMDNKTLISDMKEGGLNTSLNQVTEKSESEIKNVHSNSETENRVKSGQPLSHEDEKFTVPTEAVKISGEDSHKETKKASNDPKDEKLETPVQCNLPKVGCEVEESTTHVVPDEEITSPAVTDASVRLEAEEKQTVTEKSSIHEEKKDDDRSSESSHTSKGKHSRDSSLERSWRPQPPPPPLFDDEDDDDDWLS